ncbi:uncharacterized protein GGS22DRAFT_109596 [Annulohypoxylon maeteangense]|uniref:uncharacterized protein n=1 Tax=Annulohypoxylon maeteangense TaxID=1927788 RepID=UPI0020087964|nr:uncharacterized protein GGS22DRAFT_109596 [Annulohypoxylon maeteangense]KAI0887446.1 hypothetical protein GGS22DRAFT_109596 [Annulohypoxylon maeteangense]
MNKLIWRRAANINSTLRPGVSRLIFINGHQFTRQASSAPSIIQPSFWKSLVPKPFRRSEQAADWGAPKKPKSKEWNPATFYIVIFLFIGSMSIQMIALKKDFDTYVRRAEVRIGLLREVVEKLQRGEEVDVEKTLGTGDAEKEKEWEEALREIENNDILKNVNKTENTKPTAAPSTPAKTEATSTDNTVPPKKKNGSYASFF